VCAHAGLNVKRPAFEQIEAMKKRDLFAKCLLTEEDNGRLDNLSARYHITEGMHPDL
jgi:hypothetical protein